MPTYTCDKCARVFKQKSGFNDHMNKKNDCSANVVLNAVVDAKIAVAKRELMSQLNPHSELVLPDDTTEKEAVLQKFFKDLHNVLWHRTGASPEKALEYMTFFFAYRLIETQKDILGLPDECKWSYIAGKNNENDVFEAIKTGVASFRSKPKTKPFFKYHEIQKADVVFEIVRQINRIPLKALQESDTLGNIFEYMLGRGMSTMSDEGQYFTNRIICKLAFKLAYAIKKKLRRADGSLCTFADWFCGTGGFPAEYVRGVNANLKDVNWKKESGAIYCQDKNVSSVTTTLLNMLILTGIPFQPEKIRSSDSFSDPITLGPGCYFPGLTVDYCFMNPPYGGDTGKGKEYRFAYSKKVKAEDGSTTKKFFVNQEIQNIGIEDDDKVSAGVQLAMATLSADGGVCSIVLPQGFFFGKSYTELRKKIADEYKICYVVDIPSGSFINTKTKTSMMVFQKGVGPTEKVSFIGLDEKQLVEATLEELKTNHYSLNFKQYLPQNAAEVEGFEMVKLGDIAEWQMGKRIVKDKVETGKYPVYGGGGITFYTNTSNRSNINCKISREGMSEANCVLMITGDYYQNSQGMTVASKDTQKVLNSYLWNWLVVHKKAVYECGEGTAQKAINMVMLNNLDVPIPSIERQEQIVKAIDGWTNLAQNEEASLNMLEKQMIFHVKEMGRGQTRVKLGSVLKSVKGKRYPVGEGKESGKYPLLRSSKEGKVKWMDDYTYEGPYITVGNGGEANFRLIEKFNASTHTLVYDVNETVLKEFAYYSIQSMCDVIGEMCFQGTGLENLSTNLFMEVEIPLPPLTDQQTLQPEFDEIRHKRAKITSYKTKAQEAIQRLIPGAST